MRRAFLLFSVILLTACEEQRNDAPSPARGELAAMPAPPAAAIATPA